MAECCVHSGVESVRTCTACGRDYCSACYLTEEDQVCRYCRDRLSAPPATAVPKTTGDAGSQPAQPAASSQTALIALILSICGLPCCGACGILHIISLILAIVAKREIREHPGMQGEGNATAAFWISIVGLVLLVLGIIVYAVLIALGIAAGLAED